MQPAQFRSESALELLLEGRDSLLKLIHTSAGINELLLTGEEGMALGANFNLHLAALGGSGNYLCTASARNDALLILGMQSLFHIFHLR